METSGRRKFLLGCLGGITAAAAGLTAYPLFRYLAPRKDDASNRKVEIAAADVPAGGAKFFQFEGKAAVLIRTSAGTLTALSAVCTHLGCIVQWQKDKEHFLCPCHGGQFSPDGTVMAGPPPKPLAKIPFIVANDKIIVG